MKKILLLTDFSEASKKAIHFAQALFDDTAAEFCLLHAYPLESDTMYGTTFLMEEAEQNAYRSLQEMLSELMANYHPPFHSYQIRTAPGSPIGAVEAALEQETFDYVVVGASGSGFMAVLGSVATGLVRHAKTNVLVVPHTTAIRPVREVVLATDSSTLQHVPCLEPLNELVTRKSARLTALSIVNSQTPKLVGEEFDDYNQRLAQVFDSVETGPYFILDDEVEHGINTYLTTHSVDLLVTVPHRKTLMDAVWNRSLTRRLAFRPPVPLLALYDPEPVSRGESAEKPFFDEA
ncbi:universal stress protein [Larkinella punicea]|uniref:Universal stress protein n=1 Tax=Larkinella punicea TaxID=2315727 RepID=A0A368JHM6_9BACT|nr:universal stress protein [Larkinella punicea]RCR66775.1 universal stress protein [Larkinella punicea]